MDTTDEIDCCPLCMEELDLTDQTFNACPCGYQVCLWCWHQIKNEYNGLCPACRQPYAELAKHKTPLDREECVSISCRVPQFVVWRTHVTIGLHRVVRRTKQRKHKEKQDRRLATQTRHATGLRKGLQNVRVMQRNLVYVIGLPVRFADADVLRGPECFSQYGKIVKAVVNKSHLSADRSNATASAYITFANKEDALGCILAIDGYYLDGSVLRASFGTTKYCNFFLRNMQCNNPDCLYLHKLGEEEDSFTKEEMQAALHSGKAAFRDTSMTNEEAEDRAGSQFPPPHRPSAASSKTGISASARASSPAKATSLVRPRNEEIYGNTQRHAQSAAAISKLRQASGDRNNSPRSSSQDLSCRTETDNTEYPPTALENSYSKIVAGGSHSSYANGSAKTLPDDIQIKKPQLWVDTSRGQDTTHNTGAEVSPLEVLKLTTGLSSEQPAWAQPFPVPSVSQREREEQATTTSAAGVYGPFELDFEGDIHHVSSATELMSNQTLSDDVWGSLNASDSNLSSIPSAAATMTASRSSSSSFASIDAIFSHRNDSSEALAGLLGVELNSSPMIHGVPLTVPPKDEHTSRFSFANFADVSRSGMQQKSARFELLDGTTVNSCRSFGEFDAVCVGNAPSVSSRFPSSTDRSGFPPLEISQEKLHHAPLPPHPSRCSLGGDFRNGELPLSGSGTLAGESSGLAYLQQMLPNVNISLGGDFPNLSGPGSSGVDAAATPARCSSTGRRLFERSHSAGDNLVVPDSWDGGSLSSLGFDGQFGSRRESSVQSFYDPALVPQSLNGFSSNFYGLNSLSSITSSDSECERLRMNSDFGGDTYLSSSLINNS